jgi:hypothetical protein
MHEDSSLSCSTSTTFSGSRKGITFINLNVYNSSKDLEGITMPGLVIIAIVGALVTVASFLSAIGIYANAANAIQQIFAALVMITAVLGLIVLTVAIGTAVISGRIRTLEIIIRLINEQKRVG